MLIQRNRYPLPPTLLLPFLPSLIQFPLFSAKGRSLSSSCPPALRRACRNGVRFSPSVPSILVRGNFSDRDQPCFENESGNRVRAHLWRGNLALLGCQFGVLSLFLPTNLFRGFLFNSLVAIFLPTHSSPSMRSALSCFSICEVAQ